MAGKTEDLTTEPQSRKISELRIGEFLLAMDILPYTKLGPALKVSQELGLPLGRTLVVRGLLSNEELTSLLELHGMLRRGAVEFHHASDAYAMSRRRGWRVKEALSALGCAVDELETVRLGQLLVDAELLEEESLMDALQLQKLCGLPLGRVLSIDSRVPGKIVEHALDYQNSIRSSGMRYHDAVDKLKMLPFLLVGQSIRPIIQLDLKDLLIGGKVCDEVDLNPAVSFAKANDMSLEKVLLGYDWLDSRMISAAVALSALIERGYIPAQEAMEFLVKLKQSDRLEQIRLAMELSPELRIVEGELNLYKFLIASGFLNPERIRNLTREMVNREEEFGKLIGKNLDRNSSRADVKAAVVDCFATDSMLAPVLIQLGGVDQSLVDHAKNLVDLVVIGGASIEQSLLSFAWYRRALGV